MSQRTAERSGSTSFAMPLSPIAGRRSFTPGKFSWLVFSLAVFTLFCVQPASTQVPIFSDDFESGSFFYWSTWISPPVIVALISDKDTVYPGEAATIQWTTQYATELYLNSDIATIPAGQKTVWWDDLSEGANLFRLSAVNMYGSTYKDIYITAEPAPATTIYPPFVATNSGSYSSDGRLLPFVSPGDDGSDFLYEGFVTFDINMLPGNATIESAYFSLGTCSISGNPAELGDFSVVNLQYGTLDADDYGAGGAYITTVEPCPAFSLPIDVTARVEAMKLESNFQIRMFFSSSNYDGSIDDVTYTSPTLEITYTIQ